MIVVYRLNKKKLMEIYDVDNENRTVVYLDKSRN